MSFRLSAFRKETPRALGSSSLQRSSLQRSSLQPGGLSQAVAVFYEESHHPQSRSVLFKSIHFLDPLQAVQVTSGTDFCGMFLKIACLVSWREEDKSVYAKN